MKLLVLTIAVLILVSSVPSTAATSVFGIEYESTTGSRTFQQYTGENLVLEAFSTTCSHCIDFHPTLSSVYEEYKDNLTLISISTNHDDNMETIAKFEDDHPTTWEIGLEKDDLNDIFGVRGTPTLLMFNPDGKLAVCLVGALPKEDVEKQMSNYLSNSNYTYNIENGACTPPTFMEKFLGSIFFPIVAGLFVYAIIIVIQRYRNKNTQ